MRSSLLVRIAAIALGVMALTLLVAAILTQQLIRVEYRQDLDRLLRQELAEVRLGLPAQIMAAQGADGIADAAEVEVAVRRYLAVNPGSERHLTVIQIGAGGRSAPGTGRRPCSSCSARDGCPPESAGRSPPSPPRPARCASSPRPWTAMAGPSAR